MERIAKQMWEKWDKMMDEYLKQREPKTKTIEELGIPSEEAQENMNQWTIEHLREIVRSYLLVTTDKDVLLKAIEVLREGGL